MALLIRGDVSGPMNSRTSRRRRPGYADYALALLSAVTAALILFDAGGDTAAPLKLAACALLPGWAVMRHVSRVEPAARLAWTLAAGAVVFGSITVVMAWTGWWFPRQLAAAVLAVAAVSFLVLPGRGVRSNQHRGEQLTRSGTGAPRPWLSWRPAGPAGRRALVPWLCLAAAVALWAGGLALTRGDHLGSWGLVTALSPLWYVSLAVVVGLCVWAVVSRTGASTLLTASSLTALAAILYGTAPLLTDAPRFPWVYKHMAVTALISETGHVDPSIDIYNRWPGFFSFSAFLGEAMGYRTPISYAAWAEFGFALVDAVLVLAIARSITNRRRVYWTAALVFTLADWVNQNYYSPQSFSYSLYLALCLLALTFLRSTPARWAAAVERRLGRIFARKAGNQDTDDSWVQPAPRHQPLVIAAVLVLQAVIVVSHQLTPYMLVLGLLPLFVAGYFRPRWVGPVLLILPMLFLIPNIDFIRDKYGLFTGFNFFANAGYKPPAAGAPLLEILFTASGMGRAVATVLTVVVGILGGAGFLRHARRGNIRTTLAVVWLAVAPSMGLFGQAYGGEARFRVYLFALPWLAIGVAWLFWAGPVRTRRAAAAATAALVALSLMFTLVHFQTAGQYKVSKAEVNAGQWLDANTKAGDLIFEPRYYFPLVQGPNYAHYLDWGTVTSLSDWIKISGTYTDFPSLQAYARRLKATQDVYIIISDEQNARAAREHRVEAPLMPQVEAAIAGGSGVQNVFDDGTVRVYKFGMGH